MSLSAGLNVRPGMEKLPAKPQWFAETAAYQHGVFGPDLASCWSFGIKPASARN